MCGGLWRTTVGGGGEFVKGKKKKQMLQTRQQIPLLPALILRGLLTLMKETQKGFFSFPLQISRSSPLPRENATTCC